MLLESAPLVRSPKLREYRPDICRSDAYAVVITRSDAFSLAGFCFLAFGVIWAVLLDITGIVRVGPSRLE